MHRIIKLVTIGFLGVLLTSAAAFAAPRAGGAYGGDNAFQFKIGGYFPSGGGQFWNDTEDVFTFDVSDLNDPTLGLTYLAGINNNLEVGFNIDFYDATTTSAYRGITDQDGFPILHDSELKLTPISVDVRFLPAGRYGIRGGRGQIQVRRPALYVGGGAGLMLYSYEEVGDFVDFTVDPNQIFFDRFKETGTTFETHVLAGVELPVAPSWALLFEAKYTWADKDLGGDFAGLGNMKFGGLTTYVGGSWRF